MPVARGAPLPHNAAMRFPSGAPVGVHWVLSRGMMIPLAVAYEWYAGSLDLFYYWAAISSGTPME